MSQASGHPSAGSLASQASGASGGASEGVPAARENSLSSPYKTPSRQGTVTSSLQLEIEMSHTHKIERAVTHGMWCRAGERMLLTAPTRCQRAVQPPLAARSLPQFCKRRSGARAPQMLGRVQPRAGRMREGLEPPGGFCSAAFCYDRQYLLFLCDIHDACSPYGHPPQGLAGC